jgi:hypothetical protein
MKKKYVVFLTLFFSCQSPENAFLRNMDVLSCSEESYPGCHQKTAHCFLDKKHAGHVFFPDSSPIKIMIKNEIFDKVFFSLFFVSQKRIGTYGKLTWHEPGCSVSYEKTFSGENIFESAYDTNIFSYPLAFTEAGEHLIQWETDMEAEAFIKINIETSDP